jgi:hypothetical protein
MHRAILYGNSVAMAAEQHEVHCTVIASFWMRVPLGGGAYYFAYGRACAIRFVMF